MKYVVTMRKTKYGYDTHVPALPGCHSQGNTEREAIINTEDAILTYLDMEKKELKDVQFKEIEVTL